MRHPGGSILRAPRALGALLVASAVAMACSEGVVQVGENDVVEIRVSPDSSTLGIGRTLQLRAVALDETGAAISGIEFNWTSSDATVATVDADGLASGVGAGSADIAVTGAGFTGSVNVTVELPPEIVVSNSNLLFTAVAGGVDPAPVDIDITNGGFFALTGLAVDSIVTSGATWLTTSLDEVSAPAVLTLTPITTGLTTAGEYEALVCLSGIDATVVCITVRLVIEPADPAEVAISAGDGQTAAVGTDVPVAPAVLVTDMFDNPVPSVQVIFTATQGGGSVTEGVAETDANGVATVGSWTLGMTAGDNELTATPAGLTGIAFSATAVPAAPAAMAVNDGDNQNAVAGAQLATSPSVLVTDAFGNGVEGVTVDFEVASGGGSITGASASTDADGIARVGSWTLGGSAGSNELLATSPTLSDSVTFTAIGISGAAVAIQLEAGDAQTDTVAATLPVDYAVKVVDINGNGVAGVTVSWAVTGGGGSIPSTSVTDVDGVAVATRVLGTTAGAMMAEGGVGGLTGSPVMFDATATAGAPALMGAIVGGDGQTATVGTNVAVAPSVLVQDQFANPIAGHEVTFGVIQGFGALVDPVTPIFTDALGRAQVTSWTYGTQSGTNNQQLQATSASGGITGNPVTFTGSADADVPFALDVTAGDGQTAITGNNVANPPTVTVTDQYGNPVPGVTIDFSASGSGSAGTPSTTTNGAGQALTTWTVDVGGASLQTDGTFPNQLTVDAPGTGLSTFVGANAIYSYASHVNPMWAAEGCTSSGCHGSGGSSDLFLIGTASFVRSELVNVVPVCDGGLGSNVRVVSPLGGEIAADSYSVLYDYATGNIPRGACGGNFMTVSGANQAILRAWILNGAPNN